MPTSGSAGHELEVLPPSGKFYTELSGNRKRYLAFGRQRHHSRLSLINNALAVERESHFTLVYGNRHGLPSFSGRWEALKTGYGPACVARILKAGTMIFRYSRKVRTCRNVKRSASG